MTLSLIFSRGVYESPAAAALGFGCTKEELDAAESHPQNLVKRVHGVSLYLSRHIRLVNLDG